MSFPPYSDQISSPYRPSTADPSWDSNRQADMSELRQEIHGSNVTAGRQPSSFHRPDHLQTLQPVTTMVPGMSLYMGSNATTPRQSAFSRDQVDRTPQSGMVGQSEMACGTTATGVASSMRMGYFDTQETFEDPTMAIPSVGQQQLGAAQWSQLPPQMAGPSLGRSTYATMPNSTSFSSESTMGMPATQFAYDSSSSANTSPNRSQAYYDLSSGHYSYGSQPSYGFYGASSSASKAEMAHPYTTMAHPEYSPQDVDSMLEQISNLYKTSNTKKMAEFYRDKWARMWLTCNYTLKPSIQISIPRTILHESYRRACESFGLEPLQAASFGKVLRSQFPDVAQRRLGGRGKTRFHYCGFGTSNDREAYKVKSLLEDEKAGRLQLSAGMSAEYSGEGKAKAKSEGHETEASASRSTFSDRSASFASTSSQSGTTPVVASSLAAADDRLAASAFATLNSAVSTPPGTSSGPLRQQQQSSTSNSGGGIPRRHTVSHSYSNLGEITFMPAGAASVDPSTMVSGVSMPATETSYSSGSHTGDQSTFASQLNSPASSLQGYYHGQQEPRNMASVRFQRSCKDLPEWPKLDDGSASGYGSSVTGANVLPPNARKAWREYECLCQDLLFSIYQGPDLVSFEQRTISFWSSLSPTTQEVLGSEPSLSEMILRADGIIFRQLLTRLDDMIGDDIPEERISGIQALSNTLSGKISGLLEGVMLGASVQAKVHSCQKVAESLDRIVKIYEAIRNFREEAMLDMTTEAQNRWQGSDSDLSHAHGTVDATSTAQTFGTSMQNVGSLHSGSSAQAPSQPGSRLGQNSVAGSFASQQSRRRDDSMGSSVSDSQYTWMSGENPSSSSASESEFSMQSNPYFDSTHQAAGSGMPNIYAPAARKWSSGNRLRLTSSRPNTGSEVSGPISASLGGLALAGQSQSQQQQQQQQQRGFYASRADSASFTKLEPSPSLSSWHQANEGDLHLTDRSSQPASPSSQQTRHSGPLQHQDEQHRDTLHHQSQTQDHEMGSL